MNTGQIRKSKKAANFTTIPNAIFEDRNLSLKAIGLLCYLLKLPPDWVINKTSLHRNLKDGRDAVLAAFKELEIFGYIETVEVREKGRFVGFNYDVSDFPKKNIENVQIFSENPESGKPITENPESVPPITGKPITDYPITEKPKSEKPELLKKESTNKDFTKEKVTKDAPPDGAPGNLFGEADPVKTKKAKQPQVTSAESLPSLYTQFIDIYFQWFRKLNGVPPKIDAANGSAAKNLISYFRDLVQDRAKEKNEILDQAATDARILESWAHLFANWHKLDNYTQNKTRLLDINSNIQNIISQIKNGKNGTTVNGSHSGQSQKSAPGLNVKQYNSSLNARFGRQGATD